MPQLWQERVSEAAGLAAEACTRQSAARPGSAAKGPRAACKRWWQGARAQICRRLPERGRGAAGERRINFCGLGGCGSVCVCVRE